MFIGIDDTDSLSRFCTTYLCSILKSRLKKEGYEVSIPRLIRLNPNIPFKTRGNGAVSLEIKGDMNDEIIEISIKTLEEFSDFDDPNTNPGIVFCNKIQENMVRFSVRALHEVISLKEALKIIKNSKCESFGYKNKRGIIGALASIAFPLYDYTYELLAYRKVENWNSRRYIDRESVKRLNHFTFDNYDYESDKIVIAPNGPDPVLFGIRGEDLWSLRKSLEAIKCEDYDFYEVFLTNQATDAHIRKAKNHNINEYDSVELTGFVTKDPWVIKKGHTFFEVDGILCSAFEPTGDFRKKIRHLKEGDKVRVFGGVKKGTINLEKIEIIDLVEILERKNPICCGKRMKSEGRGKGFQCKVCKKKKAEDERAIIKLPRKIEKGYYEVCPSARRHLARPLSRMFVHYKNPWQREGYH